MRDCQQSRRLYTDDGGEESDDSGEESDERLSAQLLTASQVSKNLKVFKFFQELLHREVRAVLLCSPLLTHGNSSPTTDKFKFSSRSDT